MGCTSSSAPNAISPNTNTADKCIQFEEETNENPSIEVDVADTEDENQTNESKVLPTCDTNEESGLHLVRNNKSSTSLAIEKDVPANGHVIESVIEASTKTQEEVKIPKLELLMDNILETNKHLSDPEKTIEKSNTLLDLSEKLESTEENIEETVTVTEPESSKTPENDTDQEEQTNEASPSQSQSSRATRWEALADIAAELPPSLAVDPITGQIYQIALTK